MEVKQVAERAWRWAPWKDSFGVPCLRRRGNQRKGGRLVVRVAHRVGWIGLTLVAVLLMFAVVSDLAADSRSRLPADHAGAFAALAGRTFGQVQQATPGVARYVTTLEIGYALHELTFAVLFAVVVLIPLRRRQRWAWWACWAVMIANVGYGATIGRHVATILARSLIGVIAVTVLLVACAPAVFGRQPAIVPP
jgi:hypothetical protein